MFFLQAKHGLVGPMEQFINSFELATKNLTCIDVRFDSIGIFPATASFPMSGVFTTPTITSKLFETHRQIYKDLREYNNFANERYVPERWNPHCTFAIGLDKEASIKTLEYCLNQFQQLEGEITEIALVKIDFLDGVHSSKTIFSTLLN
jgi:2'-5' RNA ligase